jgi:hypothetical protein
MRRTTTRTAPFVVAAFIALFVASSHASAQAPRAAMGRTVPDLNFTGVTLADAIEFLRDVSGANIHVNWQAIEAVGVGKDTQINLHLRNIPLRKVLQLILREAGSGDLLTFYIDDGIIEVTTKELADQDMITKIYPVDDLIMEVPDFDNAPDFQLQGSTTGGGSSGGNLFGGNIGGDDNNQGKTRAERAQELIDIIQAVIQPDVWDINGGRAAIRFLNGSLIVTAPRSVHEALGRPVD